MHSNLSSYEEVVASAHLPARIRPSFLAFGTLADGFLPFQWESQEKESAGENKEHGVPLSSAVKLASVVMKVVQARHAGIEALRPPGAGGYESAGKLGDDESASKLQLDPLVPEYERQSTIQRLKALASSAPMDSEVASRALALAYAAVTSETLLK